jgi:hypothetical protein
LCEETLEKTEALAYRWGLRAPWAALLVLQLAIGNVRSQPEKPSFIYDFSPLWGEIVKEIDLKPIWDIIGPIPEGTPLTVNGPRDVVLLALNYRPEAESRDDFLKRVRRAARTAMDEIEEDLSHSVGLERAGVRSELRSHVRLLYLAICPDPGLGRPLTNEEIVLREHVENETTVSKAVNSIAGLLDIHTGRRPGRPPKP